MNLENKPIHNELLKYLAKKGGSVGIADLHVQGKIRGFAHQAFSELMEELTEKEFVTYDGSTFHLTGKGIDYCKTLSS
jgi:hypothetical protein